MAERDKKKLSRRALARLREVEHCGEHVPVLFKEGPLGLQIIDVPGKGVLVWHVDGQALESGKIQVGAKVVAVAKKNCEEMDLAQVFELVKAEVRPVEIEFRMPNDEVSSVIASTDDERERTPSPPNSPPTPPTPPSPTIGAQMRLEQVDRSVSTRLRKLSLTEGDGVNATPTVQREKDTVSVVFQTGPLGMQISDVGKRVLVTSFESNPDGSMGQAEKSGLVHFGSQVIRIGKTDVEGMSMHQIGMLVAKQKRPVVIEFRRLYEKNRKSEPSRVQRKKKKSLGGVIDGALAVPADNSSGSVSGQFHSEVSGASDEAETRTTVSDSQSNIDGNGYVCFEDGPTHCICSPEMRLLQRDDPMIFHFQLLCKSAQIKILLDFEDSTMKQDGTHASFELSVLPMNTMYRQALENQVKFCDWPEWIRDKYIEAYIEERRKERDREAQNGKHEQPHEQEECSSPRSPRLNDVLDDGDTDGEDDRGNARSKTVGDLCEFCKMQRSTVYSEEHPEDEMYVHFNLLFRTVKILAERESKRIDQTGYLEYLDNIDVEVLYKACAEDGISLHEWIDWIKKQCIWGYEAELFKISLSGDSELDLRDMIQANRPV